MLRTLDIYGLKVAISGEPTLLDRLGPYLSMWTAADVALPAYTLRVFQDSDDDRTIWACRDAEAIASGPDVPTFLTNLQAWLDRAAIEHMSPLLTPLHAGVVAFSSRAILLPAASGWGKTSLVAALLRRGAAYYSDEFALLDSAGRVLPYPRPLLVRRSSLVQHPVLASDLGASCGRDALEIALIASLRYEPDRPLQVERLSRSDAVLLLLRHTFTPLPTSNPDMCSSPGGAAEWRSGETMWKAVVRATDRATCIIGVRGEADEAVETLLRIVDVGRPTAPPS